MDRPVEDSGEVPDTMGTKMPEVVGGDPVRALRPSHLDPFYGINCVGWTELVRKIDKFYTMQTFTNLPVQSGWGEPTDRSIMLHQDISLLSTCGNTVNSKLTDGLVRLSAIIGLPLIIGCKLLRASVLTCERSEL